MPAVTGVAVGAVLQAGVGEGIGDHVHLGFFEEAYELEREVIIVIVHGGGMACRNTALHSTDNCFPRHCLHKAGLVIGIFIAVDIDERTVFFREVKDKLDIAQAVLRAVLHVG